MADYTLFPAKVVTPEGVCFDGEVREIEVTSVSGGLGILARRSPIVADLKMGKVRAQLEDGSWRTWASAEGFAQASESTATVIVEEAIDATDITAEHADEIIANAEERLKAHAGHEADAAAVAAAEKAKTWGLHLKNVMELYSK